MQNISYRQVCIESFGYVLPSEIVSSDEIERRLDPLYERLKLPQGRLELMTGIRERRFWEPSVRPSQPSIQSCRQAIAAAQIDPNEIGCLIHGSVCRDFLEPATASAVHHGAGLPSDCVIYDVSNACLGILNGVLQAANMIELGQIKAALVVGSEGGRQLVEGTIAHLNQDQSLTRKSIKPAFASLTIGSASSAFLLTHSSISKTQCKVNMASVNANTRYHDLCQSDQDQAGSSMQPLMDTDSEELLRQGVATGKSTFELFKQQSTWQPESIDMTVCHQVGVAHQKLMLEQLGLDPQKDFCSYPWLGNTGSAALPVTMAVAAEQQKIEPNAKLALLGIGSGINSVMIAVEYQSVPCQSNELE